MRSLPVLALCVLATVACVGHPVVKMADRPDPRYRRYERILSRLAEWSRAHADVFHREVIGRTHRGEPIWAVRVSRPPTGSAPPRPRLLVHAAQHANEANGTNAVMVMLERLLENRDRDPRIEAMVRGLETWFVPVVNVDGYRKVMAGAPGWRRWRKNGRETIGDGEYTFGDGVDLNRNWDHRFNENESPDPAHRNYKGPHPFSEPETVALRDLILRERPVLVLDLHSPGTKTPPNRVFWPWLVRETGEYGPDAEAYRAIAMDFAARLETEVDGVTFDGEGPGFDTLSKEQNWVYRETGACVLLVEISGGFWWEGPIVDVIAERVARGGLDLLERALTGPGIAGRVIDAKSGDPLPAVVEVAEAHDPAIGPRRTDPATGAFFRLLEPGVFSVTVRAEGRRPEMRRVEVERGGWTRLEVRLAASP